MSYLSGNSRYTDDEEIKQETAIGVCYDKVPANFTYDKSIIINDFRDLKSILFLIGKLLPYLNTNILRVFDKFFYTQIYNGCKDINIHNIILQTLNDYNNIITQNKKYNEKYNEKIVKEINDAIDLIKGCIDHNIYDIPYDCMLTNLSLRNKINDALYQYIISLPSNYFNINNHTLYHKLQNIKITDDEYIILYSIWVCKYLENNNIIYCRRDINTFLQTISILSNIDIETLKTYFSDRYGVLYKILVERTINNFYTLTPDAALGKIVETIFELSENGIQNCIKVYMDINDLQLNSINCNIINIPYYEICENNENVFKLNTFNVSKDINNHLINILSKNKNNNILIYGEPGIGKTEYIKSLLSTLNKDYIKFDSSYFDQTSGQPNHEKLTFIDLFKLGSSYANYHNKIVLYDECDPILNTGGFEKVTTLTKSSINILLDNSTSNNIWITNHIYNIDNSTMRRFNYILKFEPRREDQNIQIWKQILKDNITYKFTKKELKNYVTKYPKLTPAYITNIVHNSKIISADNKKNFIYNLNLLADNLYKNIFGDIKVQNDINDYKNPVKQYSLQTININYNPTDIIKSVQAYKKLDSKAGMAMSLLFTGEPGTGKTEFAKEIAKQCNQKLMIKRYSDLSSMYVGECEKNIAECFKKAQEDKAILLIDECDSFLQSRQGARNRWEITEVNEMLTQIEAYRGVLIMTTNFIDNLDPAVARRFRWKVKFNALTDENKQIIYKKYFNKKHISEEGIYQLNKLDNLTFGDFKSVYERLSLIPGIKKEETIIEELKHEISYKNKSCKIGF